MSDSVDPLNPQCRECTRHAPVHRVATAPTVIALALLIGCGDVGGAEAGGGTGGPGGGGGAGSAGGAGGADVGPAAPDFSCVGKPYTPALPQGPDTSLTLMFSYFAALDDVHVLTGATVSACEKEDPLCEAPIATAEESASPGLYELMLPLGTTGFDGLFRVASPLTIPFGVYADPPVVSEEVHFEHLLVDSPISIQQTFASGDLALEVGRGLAFVLVLDCQGNWAPGVTLAIEGADDLATVEYLDALGLYVDSGASAVGASGTALAMNLPLSPVRIRATAPSGEVFESRSFVTLAGGAVVVYVLPRRADR